MSRKYFRLAIVFPLLMIGVLVLGACTPASAPAPANPPAQQAAPTSPAAASPATAATGTSATPSSSAAAPAGSATAPASGAAASTPGTLPSAGNAGVAAKNPGTFVEATYGDPESLDPAWAYDTASGEVVLNVYETLVFPKRESSSDFVPMLATKWDMSQDGKTYTFTIRKGVKFQEGQDLTPEDVAYSFWRGMIQDRSGGPQWILLQPFFGLEVQSFQDDVVKKQFNNDWTKAAQAVEQAVTFDNNAGTVTMHLKQPYGPMLQILSGTWASIVSKPWVIKQGGWDGSPANAQKFHDPTAEKDELFKTMNGTGPYKFSRWAPGEEVDLTANPSYWVTTPLWNGGPSGPAKVQNVIIKDISEWGTRFSMLQTGDADFATVDRQYTAQVDPLVKETCDYKTNNCTQANANGKLRLYKGLPTVIGDTIFLNENVNATGGNNSLGTGKLDGNGVPADFFSDIHIRKAFNYAFDWDTYIKQVWNGEAEQMLGPIINGELGYNPNQAHYTFDLNKAKQEFQASSLKSPDGKSVWDEGFYIQFVYNTGNDQRRVAGEILKADLAKLNSKFKVSIVDEPFPVFLKDQVAGRMPLFMLGWQEDYHDPQDWVSPFLVTGGTYGGTQHFPADVQSQMDKIIDQAVQSSNQQDRARMYGQLQDLAYQNALDVFVVQRQERHYEQLWVQGWYYNPTYPGSTPVGEYFYALSK